MTGLDCLREEIAARGLPTSQINSKLVAICLDIFANSGTKYTEMWERENESTKRLNRLSADISNAKYKLVMLKDNINRYELEEKELRSRKNHLEDYIDDFNKRLEECETQEGRDAMRTAQMFVNSVDVSTKYDNTAFIIGLASILSKGGINALGELKKINKKMPIANEWKDKDVAWHKVD